MPIILITGGSGKLGSELKKIYPNSLIPTRQEMDIIKKKSVFDYIKSNKIDLVIHTAALTDVRLCENNKELAWQTNVTGTQNLIDALKTFSEEAKFVFISTACVFSGEEGNYNENSIPHPKNFYSLTKLVAEFIVKQHENHLIIRTNFVGRERWPFDKAFIDRYGTYLFADEVVRGVEEVLSQNMDGIVHICGDEKMSMYDLAKITRPDVGQLTLEEDGKFQGLHLTKDMSLNSVRIDKYTMQKFINND